MPDYTDSQRLLPLTVAAQGISDDDVDVIGAKS